ncbi:unnamed protein product [Euphydryas editha]|uniref:Uncharacterized protein n=1 Tax=Euphydryas editha TaxID=104508 RepID=A0AAU9VEY8_EUPED|nr:unnamed protein product [Euphydryas editha]
MDVEVHFGDESVKLCSSMVFGVAAPPVAPGIDVTGHYMMVCGELRDGRSHLSDVRFQVLVPFEVDGQYSKLKSAGPYEDSGHILGDNLGVMNNFHSVTEDDDRCLYWFLAAKGALDDLRAWVFSSHFALITGIRFLYQGERDPFFRGHLKQFGRCQL